MSLTTSQQILIEQQVANQGKSMPVAYILWVLFNGFGGHRFYLRRIKSAVVLLLLTLTAWTIMIASLAVAIANDTTDQMPAGFPIGIVLLMVVGLWCIIDLFLIPGMVRENNDALRKLLTAQLSRQQETAQPGLYAAQQAQTPIITR